jgi:hypothetical protein
LFPMFLLFFSFLVFPLHIYYTFSSFPTVLRYSLQSSFFLFIWGLNFYCYILKLIDSFLSPGKCNIQSIYCINYFSYSVFLNA